jgi:signal transduction histidine kinase
VSLSDFIEQNMEPILLEWEEFAGTVASAHGLDKEALRDHAEQMLRMIAAQMRGAQTDAEQKSKSRGQSFAAGVHGDTAAQLHANRRFAEGFTLDEMVSEYRAMRASVIRLWIRDHSNEPHALYELTRFNEGIDELLTESVARFSKRLDRARELFMGVLGHDLRTHLQVILGCAAKLQTKRTPEQVEQYGSYIAQSTTSINEMVEDLLDVARTRLGGQLPLTAAPMDAGPACVEALIPFRQLHPQSDIRLQRTGDLRGVWDKARLIQLLTNLLRNAFQHGDTSRPITLDAQGLDDHIVLSVHNFGEPIPRDLVAHIFEPMRQGRTQTDATSVGLGLYIACTITEAHGGKLTVESSKERGTLFTLRLPRKQRTGQRAGH